MRFGNFANANFKQLNGQGGISPAWASGGQAVFDLKGLPLLRWGNHIEKLAGILLTFVGVADTSGTTATAKDREMDALKMALIKDLQIDGAWHGVPVGVQSFRNFTIPTIARLASCFSEPREQAPIVASATDQAFEVSVFVPLCDLRGRKGHHSALPTLFYADAQLTINFGTTGDVEDGGTNTLRPASTTVVATAVMFAEREIVMGPVAEWQLFETIAKSGTDEVSLQNLGSRSGLLGSVVAPDAAISDMLIFTSAIESDVVNIEAGSFAGDSLTRFACDFLGIKTTKDLAPLWAILDCLDGGRHQSGIVIAAADAAPTAIAGYLADRSGWPRLWQYADSSADDIRDQFIALGAMASGRDMELTKLPVVSGTQSYMREATINADSSDRTLVCVRKRFTDAALAEAKSLLMDAGIVSAVIGRGVDVEWEPLAMGKNAVRGEKTAFLPRRLAPPNKEDLTGR